MPSKLKSKKELIPLLTHNKEWVRELSKFLLSLKIKDLRFVLPEKKRITALKLPYKVLGKFYITTEKNFLYLAETALKDWILEIYDDSNNSFKYCRYSTPQSAILVLKEWFRNRT